MNHHATVTCAMLNPGTLDSTGCLVFAEMGILLLNIVPLKAVVKSPEGADPDEVVADALPAVELDSWLTLWLTRVLIWSRACFLPWQITNH